MAHSDPIDTCLAANLIQVKEDIITLKKKGIKSPNTAKMKYFVFDKRTKAKYFFKTIERYLIAGGKLIEGHAGDFVLSHPKLLNVEVPKHVRKRRKTNPTGI